MNRWQAELASLSLKGGNYYPNLIEYIINLHKYYKKNIRKWNTT